MSFSKDVASFSVNAMKATDEVKRAAVLRLFFRIVQYTPVDTGRARSNWFATGQSPSVKITTDNDKSGSKAEARIRQKIYALKDSSIMHLTNNLPYIKRLEYGHSAQAPSGMLRINLLHFERYLQEEAKRRGL